ncbi:hypothetical protein FOA52_004764 [Chlamydomonas sp. UWO 241]|nr:hypothetical protein FOA52_004764 [Chlamydomonas sp. UWO 241]
MGRGPLVARWTAMQTAAIYVLPIYPSPPRDAASTKAAAGGTSGGGASGRLDDSAGHPLQLFALWLVKGCMFGIVVAVLSTGVGGLARDTLQALGMYCFVSLLMDGPASLVMPLLGINVIPTFDPPWLSTSLADFWGRRWNITTSHLLRAVVFDPIAEGTWVKAVPAPKGATGKRPPRSATLRALGVCATFLVSGVVHEAIFWAMQPDGTVTWKWLVYFTIQGQLMLAEDVVVKRAIAAGWTLHPWVSRVLTVSFLLLVAHWGFFAPCNEDTDVAARVVAACQRKYDGLISRS